MIIKILHIIIFLLLFVAVSAQDDTTRVDSVVPPLEIKFRPQISLGTGMFTYYGDIANNNKGYHPTVSRLARDLRITQPLNPNFDLSFYVIFGQVSANERTLTRNLNFNSHITTGGAVVTYNLYHLLNPKRNINPYISLGVESIEFLSKTDLKDKNGNTYYYWSDGSIRNMDENDPNASNAVEIYRDYTYESDLREENLDGFGKYQERTMAIPIDIGANLHLSDRIKVRLGASMHYTFSDLIDNVSYKSVGNRKGDSKNDRFLFTHFAITYDFGTREVEEKPMEEETFTEEDWLAIDTSDYDGDGVVDLLDDCIKTPKEAFPVDEHGCPLDGDKDLVPDYRDEEPGTFYGDLVDLKGVTQDDYDLELRYLAYMGSDGDNFIEEYHKTTSGEEGLPRDEIQRARKELKYTVVVGMNTKEISANDLHEFLSYKDFKTIERGDSVFYVIGGFNTIEEALGAKEQLKGEGINTESIALMRGKPAKIHKLIGEEYINTIDVSPVIPKPSEKGVVYRVQIGAFSKRISHGAFGKLSGVEEVKGQDGLYRYYSGVFTDKDLAAKHRIEVLSEGYEKAFLVAFNDGKRISLEEAGFKLKEGAKDEITESSEPTQGALMKGLVKFRVQVGAYKNDIPTEVLDVYLRLGSVIPKRDVRTGITKYLVGKYDSYEEVNKAKQEIIGKGILDAFIVGDFNGKLITVQEAIQLTK